MSSPSLSSTPRLSDRETSVFLDQVSRVASTSLVYAADRHYTGWDYSDGMSSRIRQSLPFENRWVNLGFQEVVKRSPVNLRPLFLVEQRRSFKGTGLFVLAHRNLDVASTEMDYIDHATEATRLAEWLVENRCRGYSGFCGGHRHQNQHLDHKTFPSEPDVVATSYAVKGLLAASAYDGAYADVAETAADFLVEDMNYRAVDRGAKIDYYPKDTADHYTVNAGAIAARTFLDLYELTGDGQLRERATALLDYVADLQAERGGWYYRDPPSASHLSMDTHHNGFVIECLLRHHEVLDGDRYAETLDKGLEFFRETLFEPDGAPNWDESSAYPRDVHAAAQGILVFSKAGELDFARRIVEWTLEHLYAGDGRFYFREQRFYTKRITLMRWCQAWMAYALSTFLVAAEAGAGRSGQ